MSFYFSGYNELTTNCIFFYFKFFIQIDPAYCIVYPIVLMINTPVLNDLVACYTRFYIIWWWFLAGFSPFDVLFFSFNILDLNCDIKITKRIFSKKLLKMDVLKLLNFLKIFWKIKNAFKICLNCFHHNDFL